MPNSSGTLVIRAFTAGGALPVEGAIVRIQGTDENNRLKSYSLITDRDGITKAVVLPAPSVDYSLTPNAPEQPFSLYDVEISAPGYLSKRINGLSIFSGINSIQPINMIPGNNENLDDFPRGNVNTIIPENENLE